MVHFSGEEETKINYFKFIFINLDSLIKPFTKKIYIFYKLNKIYLKIKSKK